MVQMVFTEIQSFKGVENYFTDSLLYQENNESVKQSLPDDIDSGNETDSESGENAPAIFSIKLIIAYLDDFDCNNLVKNGDEWVINENINYDYSLSLEDVFKSVDISFLHMPLPISKMACIHIEDNEGSVFIVPPTKRDQSPIIFGRSQARATTFRESDDDLEPPQFFHYARSAHCMMKRIGYSLNRGDGLIFGKGRRIPL